MIYGTLAMITFQSLAHTTTTPTVASHTAPVRVLPVQNAFVWKCDFYDHTLQVQSFMVDVVNELKFHSMKRHDYISTSL